MKILINWKQKAGLMALGSVFTIIGMLLSPISAQKDKFGDIECTSLKIGSATDHAFLLITQHAIAMWKDAPTRATIIGAGDVLLREGDAVDNKQVRINIDSHGGYVSTHGRSKGYAIMGIDEKGNGAVSTYDKNGYRQ